MITKSFSALVLSLPSKDKTVRMRIWRALRGMGCGVLRDGVYLLPAHAAQAAGFGDLESNVKAAGGTAMTVELNLKTAAQFETVRRLFERTAEYAELISRIDAAKKSLSRPGQPRLDTLVKRLRRAYEGGSSQQAGAKCSREPGRRRATPVLSERAAQGERRHTAP